MQPLEKVLIQQRCPKCHRGHMINNGQTHGMQTIVYPHYCDNCMNYEIYSERYPLLEWRVKKVPMPRFDLTNVIHEPTDLFYE
jgi:hypothetical protein